MTRLCCPEFYVALTLCAALLFATGNALQKQVASRRGVVAGLLRSPIWLLGLALTIAAFAVEIQALALGDVTIVKPLSRVQIPIVIAIGVIALGERVARSEWLGIGMILVGAVCLGLQSSDGRVAVPPTAVTSSVAIAVGAIVAASFWLTDRRSIRRGREHAPALAAGAFFGLGDILMKAATSGVRARTGDFNVVSTGTLASLGDAPELALSLVATVLAFLVQQVAFARGRVSLVVPLAGVAGTAVVVVLGAVLLREQVTVARAASIALMLAGTVSVGHVPRGPKACKEARS